MRFARSAVVLLLVSWTVTALAQAPGTPPATEQPPAPPAAAKVKQPNAVAQQPQQPALPEEIQQNRQMFIQMGMDPQQATMMSILASGDIDPMMMLMIMGAMDGGGGDMGDIMGMMLFSRAFQGGQGAKQPNWWRDGDYLYIIEDETIYKINYIDMQVEGKLEYKQKPNLVPLLMTAMQPAIKQQQEKAKQTVCQSNMKQVMLGMLMFAQDHNETLPGEAWAEDIMPYVKNEAIFTCPVRPQLKVGYAMNEKLIGAELQAIERPAEVVALFESNTGGDNPVGNAADIPEEGVHHGGIVVGFVDGHVQWVPVAEARKLVEKPVID